MSVITNSIETKPIPSIWRQQWMKLQNTVRSGTQTDDAADEQIGKSRMVIPAAAFRIFYFDPFAGFLVEIPADVRLAFMMLTMDVGKKRVEVVARCYEILWWIIN